MLAGSQTDFPWDVWLSSKLQQRRQVWLLAGSQTDFSVDVWLRQWAPADHPFQAACAASPESCPFPCSPVPWAEPGREDGAAGACLDTQPRRNCERSQGNTTRAATGGTGSPTEQPRGTEPPETPPPLQQRGKTAGTLHVPTERGLIQPLVLPEPQPAAGVILRFGSISCPGVSGGSVLVQDMMGMEFWSW